MPCRCLHPPLGGKPVMRWMRPRRLVTATISAALLTTASAIAAAQGTLTGSVTAQSGEPLQEARVIVVGTSRFTTTAPDGKYTIRGVPAGTAEVRVIRVGVTEQKKSVAIIARQ